MEYTKILGYHEKIKPLNCWHRRSKREESQIKGSDNAFNKIIKRRICKCRKRDDHPEIRVIKQEIRVI